MIKHLYLLGGIWLVLCSLITTTQAQTITTGTPSKVEFCSAAGGTLTIPFSVTGLFTSGNQFTAQLSDAVGNFTTPLAIGTITATTSSTASVANQTIPATIPANLAAGTGYRVQVVSTRPAKTGTPAAARITIDVAPTPPTTTPVSTCPSATPVTLTATGTNLKWYTASGSATTSTADVSTPGTTTYYVTQTNADGCESPKAALIVTVYPKPSPPGVADLSYCQNITANALTATGTNLKWYSGNTLLANAPTPSTVTTGQITYSVTQTNASGCESDKATLTVTVAAPPAAPGVSPLTYCQNTQVGVLTASGANLKWYGTNPSGINSTTAAPTPSTGTPGTTTFYVTQTVNGCESQKASLTVTITAAPAAPTVTATFAYCQGFTAPALIATGTSLKWYGPNLNGVAAAPVPGTNTPGTVTYQVTQTVNGCESSQASISVTTKPTPAAPATSAVSLCQGQSAGVLTATTANGATLNWYGTNPTSGTAGSAPTPSTTATGVTTYYVSQTLDGCESQRTSLAVTVNAVPAAPTVTPAGPYCQNISAAPLQASGANLKWYGTSATDGTATNQATTPSTGVVGTQSYYVSQSVNNCESQRAVIQVTVKPTPGSPSVTPLALCQGAPTSALTAGAQANATLRWYGTSASGGTALPMAPTPSDTATGQVTYYVSQVLDGCESPRAALTVQVSRTPGQPSISPPTYCQNAGSQPLTAQTTDNGTRLNWFDQNGTALGGAPTPSTSTPGTLTYRVSQSSDAGCVGPQLTVSVVINPLPGAPGTSNLTYCQSQTDQPAQNVGPLTANGQSLRWYNPDGNAYPSAPTPSVDATGVINFQVSQTVNNCEGPKASIQVSVQTTPPPVIPNPTVTYCRNDTPTQLTATGTNLNWIDPYGRVTTTAPTPATQNASKPGGDTFYVYQIGSNGCYSPRAAVNVIVNTNPTLALSGSTAINLGQSATLTLRFTGVPPFNYTLVSGATSTTGVATDTVSTVAVTPTRTSTYQVGTVSNVCGVGLPGNPATAVVTVNAPTITVGNLASTTLCAGLSFTVPFSSGGNFNLNNGFKAQLVPVADTATATPIDLSQATFDNPLTAAIPLTTPSGQYKVRLVRTVNDTQQIQVISAVSGAIITVRSLPTATLTGTQQVYQGSPASLTVTFTGDGPWTFSYADSLTTTLTSTQTPYIFQVQPGHTQLYQLRSVSNNCGNGSISGEATVTLVPVLAVDDPLDLSVKLYPIPVTNTLTVELENALLAEPATFELTDLTGRPLLQQVTRNQQTTLDLTRHPAGLYLLKVQVGQQQTVRKLLKQ